MYSYYSLFIFIASGAAQVLNRRFDQQEVKHSWLQPPSGWVFHSLPPPNYEMNVTVSLKQDRYDELMTDLHEISDPNHERYGNHLTIEEVIDLTAPHPDSIDIFEDWLSFHDVDSSSSRFSAMGDTIMIRLPVSKVEKMLNTEYAFYYHEKGDDYVLRTLSYSLPKALMPHIALVTPTTYFGTLKSMKSSIITLPDSPTIRHQLFSPAAIEAVVPSSCNSVITPSCLVGLYNMTGYIPQVPDQHSIGVAGFLDEFANHDDLKTFSDSYLNNASVSFDITKVNGGRDDQSDPGANLDIQYTVGLSHPIPNHYYSTSGSAPFNPDSTAPNNTNEPYQDFLMYFLIQKDRPQVLSVSYGEPEQTVPRDYAERVCWLFGLLGGMGTSVLISSGDSGVGGGNCKANDGSDKVLFQPTYPASCPYVTAVGGTMGTAPENAAFFSGGGFSRYFTKPSYQNDTVSKYVDNLDTTDSNSGLYNATGRGFPDLAAQAAKYQVIVGGNVSSISGTSASAPTVAAVISFLNDVRLADGKKALGFLNPWLYSTGYKALNDITSGSNPGCSAKGFSAGTGWDPVTGLGTPNFDGLRKLM